MNAESNAMMGAVERLLDDGRLHDALRLINDRVDHRFTGIYRFDPPTLRNVALFDSANPEIEMGEDTPLRETYCSVVGETGTRFATDDARTDPRLAAHPARETTLAYCGAPLRTQPDARPFGTLCHFDVVPRAVPVEEEPLLIAIAQRIAHHLEERSAG
jgi:GAF domain-containing protein